MSSVESDASKKSLFADLAQLVGMQIAFGLAVAWAFSFFPSRDPARAAEPYLWSGVVGLLIAGRSFAASKEKRSPGYVNRELTKRLAAWGLLAHVVLGALVALALYLRAPHLFDFLQRATPWMIPIGLTVGVAVDFSVSFWALEVGARRAARARGTDKDRDR